MKNCEFPLFIFARMTYQMRRSLPVLSRPAHRTLLSIPGSPFPPKPETPYEPHPSPPRRLGSEGRLQPVTPQGPKTVVSRPALDPLAIRQ